MSARQLPKVGDTLWCVQRWRKDTGRAVVIAKVGRTYLHIEGGLQIPIAPLMKDGETWDANRVYYMSEAAYKEMVNSNSLKQELLLDVQGGSFSCEQIIAARKALGLAT